MYTTYKNSTVKSPYQPSIKKDVFNVNNKNHPVKELIQKYTGVYNLTATFEQDLETTQKLSHFSGVVAFICTIRKNGQVVGIGRSHNILSSSNKFLEKVINASFSYSFIDAISKTTRAMDTFLTDKNIPPQEETTTPNSNYVVKELLESDGRISDKQRSYLEELIKVNLDGEERESMMNQLDDMSRQEASQMIKNFKS